MEFVAGCVRNLKIMVMKGLENYGYEGFEKLC
jgi:hypothetical protein